MAGAFLANNWGNILSAIGLLLSIATLLYSRRASKAATEARNAVLSRTLAEDLNHASRVASEVGIHIEGGQYEAAAFRVSGLIEQTSFLVNRWDTRLSEASRDNLVVALSQLRGIMDVLRKTSGKQPSVRAKNKLAQACDAVSSIFHEEHGSAVNAAESEVAKS